MTPDQLDGRRVALAVCGGIAAFKAIECLRLLTEAGAQVRVLMTPEATRFVAPLSFEALSGQPVTCDWLEPQGGGEPHIALSEWAEVLLIAPATANMLARLALGFADDVVCATALASRAALVLAPAMNDMMFTHPNTQAHLDELRRRGARVVLPVTGRLASGKVGVGRLAAPTRIAAVVGAVLANRPNLHGVKVVVTAGGTREPIDPVRYIGNFSSGKMGRALAEVASARGAEVTLVTTMPAGLEGLTEVPVATAAEMLEALKRSCQDAHVLVMAAAVADYRPAVVAPSKLRRGPEPIDLHLVPNVDVLGSLGAPAGVFRVGFAAETEDLESHARQKLQTKELDLIIANRVGIGDQGLGSDYNSALVLGPSGTLAEIPRATKWEVAERIWDAIDTARRRRS